MQETMRLQQVKNTGLASSVPVMIARDEWMLALEHLTSLFNADGLCIVRNCHRYLSGD